MGGLPEGWLKVKLSDVVELTMGQSLPSSTYNTRGQGLPFFQGKREFGGFYPITAKYCSRPIKIAELGDVLISVRAPVGPTNLCKKNPAWVVAWQRYDPVVELLQSIFFTVCVMSKIGFPHKEQAQPLQQ